jgi:hypothetical protein
VFVNELEPRLASLVRGFDVFVYEICDEIAFVAAHEQHLFVGGSTTHVPGHAQTISSYSGRLLLQPFHVLLNAGAI